MKDQALPRVLMLGWEFPPVFTGGLGIACQALAQCLTPHVELTVVVPVSPHDYIPDGYSIFNITNPRIKNHRAYKSEISRIAAEGSWRELVQKHRVSVPLDPYEIQAPVLSADYTSENVIKESVEKNKPKDPSPDDLFGTATLYDADLGHRIGEFAGRTVALVENEAINYDILYAHDWMTFPAALSLKEISGKPLVLHVHSTDYDRTGGGTFGSLTSQLEKEAFELCDKIITVSAYTAHIVETIYNIPAEKIEIVYNGYNFSQPNARQKSQFSEPIVLFLGRVTAQKGPDFFFRVINKVADAQPNCRFVMAGTGDRLKNAIETSTHSKYAHRIHFTGQLNREEVYRLYSMCDIYCMPSVSEPFGLTALEAAYSGLPCVLSKQSGAAEVLKGALTADYYDVDGFAGHILSLLQDKALYNIVKGTQKESLKDLTWEKSSIQISELFQDLKNTLN